MHPGADDVIDAIEAVARAWEDPDYGPRSAATDLTMEAPNRFTEEAVAFSVNQQVSHLTAVRLRSWLAGRSAAQPARVGVINAGRVPMDGLRDWLAVVLTGHRYLGLLSPSSPYLLPAFTQEVGRQVALPMQFVTGAPVTGITAVVAERTTEEIPSRSASFDEAEVALSRRLLRTHRVGMAVLGGDETDDELEALAEDALLHEGLAEGTLALIWAPAGMSPDGVLAAFAAFRSVFPAHEDTPGALMLPRAFLAAAGQPHAYGEGLEFLLSKGDPAIQAPGHVRWCEYDTLEDVRTWALARTSSIGPVVAAQGVAGPLAGPWDVLPPGHVHRRPLGDRRGRELVDFLIGL